MNEVSKIEMHMHVQDTVNRPPFLRKDYQSLTVKIRPLKFTHTLFFIFFAFFWNLVIWVGVLSKTNETGNFVGAVTDLLPWVVVGLGVVGLDIYLLFGRVVLTLTQELCTLSYRLFGVTGKTRRIDIRYIDRISEETYRINGWDVDGICLHVSGEKVLFGSSLSGSDRQYAIDELKNFLERTR